MDMMISVKELAFILIVIAVLVLLGYLIALVKNLVKTVKETNKILVDVEVVTAITAEKAQAIDGMIDDVTDTVGEVADLVRGNASPLKAAAVVVNSAAAIMDLAGCKGGASEDKAEEGEEAEATKAGRFVKSRSKK